MMNRNKGSLTIFAVLSMMLIAAFLFTLLEAGRMYQIRTVAQRNTESVMESVFSNYECPMWENYHLLVLDDGLTDEQGAFTAWEWFAQNLSEDNMSSGGIPGGSNHLRPAVEQVSFEEYRLLTDDNGKVYISAVSQYMKAHLAEAAIDQAVQQYQAIEGIDAGETPDASAVETADEAIAQEQQQEEADAEGDGSAGQESEEEKEDMENPLDVMKSLWTTGVISLVVENPESVSKATVSMSSAVSKRTLQQGTASSSVETDLLDSALFSKYLQSQFASYTQGNAAGTLQYEMEYLLCGKSGDKDNLCGAAERLLALREAANLYAIACDSKKMEMVSSLAVTLAGVTANAAIVAAVEGGLMAAWALAESILDVRTLLTGGKIALFKSASQWTSDLMHLGSSFGSFGKASDCSNGLSYVQYLGTLLSLQEEKSAYRAMDIQEAAIRGMEGQEAFSMDHMVTDATISISYRYNTIFLGMEDLTKGMNRVFTFSTQTGFSYRKAGA